MADLSHPPVEFADPLRGNVMGGMGCRFCVVAEERFVGRGMFLVGDLANDLVG